MYRNVMWRDTMLQEAKAKSVPLIRSMASRLAKCDAIWLGSGFITCYLVYESPVPTIAMASGIRAANGMYTCKIRHSLLCGVGWESDGK